MDPTTTPPPNTEPIPRTLEAIVYSSVEKAIRTLLLDQGYLRKRNRSRSRSRSHSRGRGKHGKSRSRTRSHSRGRHGKSRSRSRSHSRGRGKHGKPSAHGKRMMGPYHFHHHHHFGPHPAELVAEEAWPRHEGWPRHKGGHKGWGKRHHHGHRFPFAGWSKRCQRGCEEEERSEEGGDGGEVVETVDLVDVDVDGDEAVAESSEKDLQTGIEKMNVNDTNVTAEAH